MIVTSFFLETNITRNTKLTKVASMDMIQDIWDASKEILHVSSAMAKANPAEKERLSDVFSKISDVLNDMYIKLRQKIHPGKEFAQLDGFSDDLYKNASLILGDIQTKELCELLKTTDKAEKLFNKVISDKFSYEELQKLEEASGKFKVASVIIK